MKAKNLKVKSLKVKSVLGDLVESVLLASLVLAISHTGLGGAHHGEILVLFVRDKEVQILDLPIISIRFRAIPEREIYNRTVINPQILGSKSDF